MPPSKCYLTRLAPCSIIPDVGGGAVAPAAARRAQVRVPGLVKALVPVAEGRSRLQCHGGWPRHAFGSLF